MIIIALVRFILEVTALLALGYWGVQAGIEVWLKILLGISVPLLTAIVWGVFISPKAPKRLHEGPRLFLEIALFALAAAAMYGSGFEYFSVIFMLMAMVISILIRVLKLTGL
ncbi:YrdB family protein [Alkalihalophilus marmarensis]|uniref:YrdB family protein n=1 Tax=Alkalihalophilus marmarensis TaxID=521377 RepID=UPI002E1FC262|nr:YrdB family protein [Alkalihalophilus marmarensis]